MTGPAAVFRKSLAALSRDALVEFIADLWEARGWEVRREGDRLVVDGSDGEMTLVPVVDPGERSDFAGAIDVVVTAGDPEPIEKEVDARIVGPDTLRQRLLYGVEREDARVLFARSFDRPLDDVAVESDGFTDNQQSADGKSDRRPSGRSDSGDAPGGLADGDETGGRGAVVSPRSAVVASVALLVFAAIAVGSMVLSGGLSGLAGPDAGIAQDAPSTGAAPPTGTPTGVDTDDRDVGATTPTLARPLDTTGHQADVTDEYPAGLGPDGVSDPSDLAEAHVQGIVDRSYGLVLDYREYSHGEISGYRRETVRVEKPDVYRSDVVEVGTLVGRHSAVAATDSYADGLVRYERQEGATRATSNTYFAFAIPNDEQLQADRVRQLVWESARVDRTSIVDVYKKDSHTFFWIQFTDYSTPSGRRMTGSMLVDDRGVVHELRRRQHLEGDPTVTTELVVRYRQFGTITVDAPDWIR